VVGLFAGLDIMAVEFLIVEFPHFKELSPNNNHHVSYPKCAGGVRMV
jgi:hypothetical protein